MKIIFQRISNQRGRFNDQELLCVTKMNGPTRKKIYGILEERDGGFCKHCRVSEKEKQLVVDHVDNDNRNNGIENLQLLCRRCNYLKNPRGPVDNRVCENEEISEIQINRKSEPLFRKFVAHEINEKTSVPEDDLIYAGAEDANVSPETTRRYLKKMISSRGLFTRIKIRSRYFICYKNELDFA